MSRPEPAIPPRPPLPVAAITTRPRARAPLSVRKRTLLIVIAAVALSAIVIGSLSVLAVRTLLLDRVDEQLGRAADRPAVTAPYTLDGAVAEVPPAFLIGPGLGQGALGAILVDGRIAEAGYLDQRGEPLALPAAAQRALAGLNVGGAPVSVDLGAAGRYRVVARPLIAGSSQTNAVAVVGLPLAASDLTLSQLSRAIALLALATLIVSGIVAYRVLRFALRPLDRVAQAAAEVSRMPLDQGEVALRVRVAAEDADERTEVGRVGAALNRMLGHVDNALHVRHASEAKVRRFVSDASHELRTPLASIRGYAELTRRYGGELPDELDYALERIGSESIRMTGIVEDLLLLARLDEGRELDRREVDLNDLLIHAVNDATAAGNSHPVSLDIPDSSVIVIGDPQRLQQVFVNLLANARVHTPENTAISVQLRRETAADRAVVEIRDSGPGVDPRVLSTIFERFVRADGSRSRATGSSGLGLAIVESVVTAHRGTVTVHSVPGDTVFTVSLPAASEDGHEER